MTPALARAATSCPHLFHAGNARSRNGATRKKSENGTGVALFGKREQDFGGNPLQVRPTNHSQRDDIHSFVEKRDELIDWAIFDFQLKR